GKLIQKLLLNQKCMGYLVRAYYSISSTRYYKDDSCWNADVKSKTTEDIISNRSFMEVLVLNHYVLVKNVLDLAMASGRGRLEEDLESSTWRRRHNFKATLSDWNKENAKSLMCILKCFKEVSGLRVNYNKSKLYGIGVSERDVKDMATLIGCGVGEFPFTYLGLPFAENTIRSIRKNSFGGVGEGKKLSWVKWDSIIASFGVGAKH
nr:RNA-directed DNA polymerase, eukaryota, reverse transcriptase zinc-binding domain protein [Tanacetum cinerariifolium]GFA29415.1 RNA-directed DNA polymerase, eukaryota, reverse transcriptase zinc-binding domain protein [Tanacetum cinerariifolium]